MSVTSTSVTSTSVTSGLPSLSPSRRQSGQIGIGSLILCGALAIVAFGFLITFKVRTVHGNEVGVMETLNGVSPDAIPPGTYFWPFAIGREVYTYPTSGQVFVMNDKPNSAEPISEGRRVDPLVVNSLDNQKVTLHIALTWSRDPAHIVQMHKNYRDNVEERLIRPEVVNEVTMRATLINAIDLYSGPKLNELRQLVTDELRSPTGKLAQSGVLVSRFIIEKPELNPDYEKLIEQRQLAIAHESQAKEQQKANQALADSAKTAALKQQYEQVVEANTEAQKAVISQQAASDQATIKAKADALNTVTTQQAAAQVVVINAKAEADRQVAISEAAKQAEINRAVGIKAVGSASADANRLLLASYSVPGSDLYTRIQVAGSLAVAFQNVKGYLPNNVNYTTIADSFDKGVNIMVGPQQGTAASNSSASSSTGPVALAQK